MFSLIRGLIIVGVIFYFSPARDTGEPEQQAAGGRMPVAAVSPPSSRGSNPEESLWDRIVGSFTEEVVRTAVNGKAHEAGLRLTEAAGRDSPGQSVRCIYRCDGAE
jgi:hypothetical protein